jgi:hypothetical protein
MIRSTIRSTQVSPSFSRLVVLLGVAEEKGSRTHRVSLEVLVEGLPELGRPLLALGIELVEGV